MALPPWDCGCPALCVYNHNLHNNHAMIIPRVEENKTGIGVGPWGLGGYNHNFIYNHTMIIFSEGGENKTLLVSDSEPNMKK